MFKLTIVKKEESEDNDEKDEDEYKIEYIVGNDSYDILFSFKENSFISNTQLQKDNKYLHDIVKDDIDQNIIHSIIN